MIYCRCFAMAPDPTQITRMFGVERDLTTAQARGVHAVPTLVFNDRWSISGAVPEAMLRRIIDDVLAGHNPARPA